MALLNVLLFVPALLFFGAPCCRTRWQALPWALLSVFSALTIGAGLLFAARGPYDFWIVLALLNAMILGLWWMLSAGVTAWLLRRGRRRTALITGLLAALPMGFAGLVGPLLVASALLWAGWWFFRIEDEEARA